MGLGGSSSSEARHRRESVIIEVAMSVPPAVMDPELKAVLTWWDHHQRELPWRASRDVYAVWVAEVMSAQTTLLRAVAAWESWMSRWPTVAELAVATLAEVLGEWQGLGYPRRARDLHRAAQIVQADGWPADLSRLPGVGPYVSAAIRCFALEEPVLPRDVNVNRVLERRFPGGLDISADPWRAGQALMEFGQRICTVRPTCSACPVAAGCPGPGEHEAAERHARRQKPYVGSLRQRRGKLLARVLADGRVARVGADMEAADSLIRDGLILAEGPWLRAPS
jgi:A/G-specific adenine glycosylase